MANIISKHNALWSPFSSEEYECIICYDALNETNTFTDYWCNCLAPVCYVCVSKMNKCPTCRDENPWVDDYGSDNS